MLLVSLLSGLFSECIDNENGDLPSEHCELLPLEKAKSNIWKQRQRVVYGNKHVKKIKKWGTIFSN